MKHAHLFLAAALVQFSTFIACGYVVGPAVGIDDLAKQADLIFQGTAVSNTTITDPAFQPISGFIVQETEFRPAYTIKGKPSISDFKFHHYAPNPSPEGMMYAPQSYDFEIGKSYLVFAKQPPGYAADTCQQIWMDPIGMQDEGVLLCYRPFPFERNSMKELFWRDLTELLKSPDPKEVIYAITHLDNFSGSSNENEFRFGQLSEFQHLDVLAAVHGLITHPDPTVAQAALSVVGSNNPYMERGSAQYWLATVGGADAPGLARMDAKMVNEGGMVYWREIAAVANSNRDEATRALAVTALGLVREPSLQESVTRWLGDPSEEVRSGAVLLLADYPALATHNRFMAVAADENPQVRVSAAYAIGFAQLTDDADVLSKLISDSDAKVRQAAAMSLLSFSPTLGTRSLRCCFWSLSARMTPRQISIYLSKRRPRKRTRPTGPAARFPRIRPLIFSSNI
jgi:hypothetical protein